MKRKLSAQLRILCRAAKARCNKHGAFGSAEKGGLKSVQKQREYQAEQRDEAKTTETLREVIPAPVATEATEEPDEDPPDPSQGGERVDRRQKKFWTPERKANASRLAKEKWARRRKTDGEPRAIIEVKPDVFEMLKEGEAMRQLVFTGKSYELRGADEPEAILQLEALPREPQKIRLIKREQIERVVPFPSKGNGYKPGPFIDLGHDQCRYTIEGKTMCGAKVAQRDGSWCQEHDARVHGRFKEAAE